MIQIKALKCENLALLYLQIKTTVNNIGMLSMCLCLASYEKSSNVSSTSITSEFSDILDG